MTVPSAAPQSSAVPDRTADPLRLQPLPAVSRPVPVSVDAEVLANRHLTDRYRHIELHAPHIAETARPGQFVMLTVTRTPAHGPVLPRPMAVYDAHPLDGTLTVVYSVVGTGTRALSEFTAGEPITVVGPLGRPFEPPDTGGIVLLGRGIGTCSLTLLARTAGPAHRVTAVASGRHRHAVVGADFYRRHAAVTLSVDDVSGTAAPSRLEARLTRLLDAAPPALVAACGSRRLVALGVRLAGRWGADLQVAVEAHMACGLGYCHGCAAGSGAVGTESPLVCTDGPVFRAAPRYGNETNEQGRNPCSSS